MKKVLLITTDFPPNSGGVARYLSNLAVHLPSDKIVVLAPPDDRADDSQFNFKIYRTKLFWPLWPKWLPMIRQVGKIALREKAEILWAAQPLPVGTVVLMISKFLRFPYILNTHGMDLAKALSLGGRKTAILRKVLKGAKAVTYNSNYTKNLLDKFDIADDKLIQVLPCPKDVSGKIQEKTS